MRHSLTLLLVPLLALVAIALSGCPSRPPAGGGGAAGGGTSGDGSAEAPPSFSLAWSEYPSWSVFGVAHEKKLIDGDEGELGPIEKKWNVDIVLSQEDYLTCLTSYGSAKVDAVCITNTDVLAPAMQRAAVAILPTSTSDGADALIAVGIDDIEGLKGVSVYGAALSVSQYCFERNLELAGEDLSDYEFKDMSPDAAASAIASGRDDVKAVMVWNPYVLNILKEVDGARSLFDSTKIPGEIIDMVVMSEDSLAKPGGEDFACAVIDAFYQISDRIEEPETHDETLVALAREFAALDVEDMERIVDETKFYKTPDAALAVFTEEEMAGPIEKITEFCRRHDLVTGTPKVVYGGGSASGDAHLLFDTTYIERVRDKQE